MPHVEIATQLLEALGVSPSTLLSEAVKWAGATTAKTVAEATSRRVRSIVGDLFRRRRALGALNAAENHLANAEEGVESQEALKDCLQVWLETDPERVSHAQLVLFRLIYLRAVEAACRELPSINLLQLGHTLDEVLVRQNLRYLPERAPKEGSSRVTSALPQELFEDLPAALERAEGRPILLIGDFGVGKSTQLRSLALNLAAEALSANSADAFLRAPLPVFVTAGSLMNGIGEDLTSAITRAVRENLGLHLPFPLPDDFLDVRDSASPKSFLVLVDGLDEVGHESRGRLAGVLSRPDLAFRFVVGSRRLNEHELALWRGYMRFELEELSSERTAELVSKLGGDSAALRDQSAHSPRNPLLLTLMVVTGVNASEAVLHRDFILLAVRRAQSTGQTKLQPHAAFELLWRYAMDPLDATAHAESIGALEPASIRLHKAQPVQELLAGAGLLVRRSGNFGFYHEALREYLIAEALASANSPSQSQIWEVISPFVHGWRVCTLAVLIWHRDNIDFTAALDGLFAFGEDGLRALSTIAAQCDHLPRKVIERLVGRWSWTDDDFWGAGHTDGPIQQLERIGYRYPQAKKALRTIASDQHTYSEDSAYAAAALLRLGENDLALDLMAKIIEGDGYGLSCTVAIEQLRLAGCRKEALEAALLLLDRWADERPELILHEMYLAEELHRLGRTGTAQRLLKRVAQEVDDDLDRRFLAQAYLTLGQQGAARRLALTIFESKAWMKELQSSYRHNAEELMQLLERTGAHRPARHIRQQIAKPADKNLAVATQIATSRDETAQRRLSASAELAEHGLIEEALSALRLLALDRDIWWHNRFETFPIMRSIPGGTDLALETLQRILTEEPWHARACGDALVRSGALGLGYAALQRVANEPALPASTRVGAIADLATLGRLSHAIAGCRRLWSAHDLTAQVVRQAGATFRFTPEWESFLSLLNSLLDSFDPHLRFAALDQLKSVGKFRARVKKLARKLLRDQASPVEVRMSAADLLAEMDEDILDDLYDIAADADEGYRVGVAAMQELSHRDDCFAAVDCGNDVVWDAKLTQDQFIEAAHSYRQLRDTSGLLETLGQSLKRGVCDELLKIAADSNQPPERRTAAAGLSGETTISEPYWPAVEAIANDDRIELNARLPAIVALLEHQPDLTVKYEKLADGDEDPIAVAKLLSATGPRKRATEAWLKILRHTLDARAQFRALAELARLGETSRVGASAKSILEDFISGVRKNPDHELIQDGLTLVRMYLGDEECRALCIQVIASVSLDDYDVRAAADFLKSLHCQDEAVQHLKARQKSQSPNRYGAYARINLIERTALLGGREEALVELEKKTQSSGDLSVRIWACQRVAATGSAVRASALLGQLRGAAKTGQQLAALAEAAAEIHDFKRARSLARQAANNGEGRDTDHAFLADLCARLGLVGLARQQLAAARASQTADISSLVKALLRLRQPQQAALLVESYWTNTEIDIFDCVEVASDLPDYILAQRLPDLAVRASSEYMSAASRVAEILFNHKHQAEARALLFSLCDRATDDIDPNERLWLCEALHVCGLHVSARRQLHRLNVASLDADEQRWRADLLVDLLPQ